MQYNNDAFAPARAPSTWTSNITGAVVHAFHRAYWGGWQFAVDSHDKKTGNLTFSRGGFQEASETDKRCPFFHFPFSVFECNLNLFVGLNVLLTCLPLNAFLLWRAFARREAAAAKVATTILSTT